MKSFFITCVALLFMATGQVYAQLNDFTITASATAQTCLGNGSVSFTVSNNNTAAALEFAVYLLPNTTVPFTTVTAMSAQNLVAGDYLIIATQTLNGQSNTATANATVADNTVPLVYTLTTANTGCGEGSITVQVSSGNPVGYEIISGPVTMPLQTSITFTGLPAGQYQVRVHNNCGDAFTTTVQLVTSTNTLQIKPVNVIEPVTCSTINVFHYAEASNPIVWPLQLEYTVYPPIGDPQVVTNTAEGPGQIITEIPFYEGDSYVYYIETTDACGNVFSDGPFMVEGIADFDIIAEYQVCVPASLIVRPTDYLMYPLTLNFTAAPPGFNPAEFNVSYPVFNDSQNDIVFSGEALPLGNYAIEITDACGRVVVKQALIFNNIFPPQVEVTTNCQLGTVAISMPGKAITGLVVTHAPATYEPQLPHDLIGSLGPQPDFVISGLPAGNYTIHLTDECGTEFDLQIVIVIPPVTMQVINLPGCEEGFGSVNVFSVTNDIASFTITGAPAGFAGTLPFDASANINNSSGQLVMAGLPGGNYTYSLMLAGCPDAVTGVMYVEPYQETVNNIQVIPNCGSFDLQLQHQSNSNNNTTTFWLQRYDENQGLWVHPGTGGSNGTQVGYYNAITLNNGTTNYNLPYTGQFRVVKSFNVYSNEFTYEACYKVLYEFTFTGAPQIEAAYGFPCDNGLAEVIVVANGVDPLTYQITSKNGQPFLIDNGTSNVFTGLEKAVYNFRVTDDCGNLINVLYDVSVLEFIEIEAGTICNGQPVQLWLPEFTFLLYEWYRADDPGTILSTSNTFNISSFDPDTDSGLYVVHVESVTPGSCIDTLLEYNAAVTEPQQAGNDVEVALCSQDSVLNLSAYLSGDYGNDGVWQDAAFTGALNGSMLNTALLNPGSYIFYYTVAQCDATDTAQITLHLLENDTYPVVLEGKCTGDSYIISIVNIEDIGATQQIEWQGPEGYSHTGNDTFIDITGLPKGEYSVQVVNADGCTAQAASWFERTDCTIPRGISPNGDEFNNNFDLSNLDVKYLVIFNRYGLKVYEANNYIDEWHGQSDKGDLPTGTYYYMVLLEDGTQRTGWVYLQREVK